MDVVWSLHCLPRPRCRNECRAAYEVLSFGLRIEPTITTIVMHQPLSRARLSYIHTHAKARTRIYMCTCTHICTYIYIYRYTAGFFQSNKSTQQPLVPPMLIYPLSYVSYSLSFVSRILSLWLYPVKSKRWTRYCMCLFIFEDRPCGAHFLLLWWDPPS